MTSKPDESAHPISNCSPAEPSLASSQHWVLFVLGCVLIALGCVLMLMPMYKISQAGYELLKVSRTNENTEFDALENTDFDIDAWRVRTNYYLVTGGCLMIVGAVLLGLRKYKLLPDPVLTASRLSDAHISGAPSWDELQKKGGTKKLFTWLWDCVSMIAGVFFFALVACTIVTTQPIFAAVSLTMAVLFPSLIKSSRRTREALFGVPSRDGFENKHGD